MQAEQTRPSGASGDGAGADDSSGPHTIQVLMITVNKCITSKSLHPL